MAQDLLKRLRHLFISGRPIIKRKVKNYTNLPPANLSINAFKTTQHFLTAGGYSTAGLFDKMQRMADFQEMDQDAIISTALDLYAEETCSPDESGNVLHIFSENRKIKDLLDDLFYNIMNVGMFLTPWVRNMCKYGDFYLFLEIKDGAGISNIYPIPVNEIEREERFDPENPGAVRFKHSGNKVLFDYEVAHFRLLGNDAYLPGGSSLLDSSRKIWRTLSLMEDAMLVYRIVRCLHGSTKLWTNDGFKEIKDIKVGDKVYSYDIQTKQPILSTVTDWINNGKQQIWNIQSKHRTIKANFNHPILVRNIETGVIEYIDVKSLIPNIHQYVVPDINIESFETLISVEPTNEYSEVYDIRVDNENRNFIAEGCVVHNSPERRVFHIGVGNIPVNEIENYMEQAKRTLKNNPIISKENGKLDFRHGALSMLEDYFLPRRNKETDNEITTLAGGASVSDIDDVNYLKDKLLAALGVPRSYLQFEEQLSSKSTLASEDLRFSRKINKIQQFVCSELNKIAIIHLMANGFDGEELLDFDVRLSNPSALAELQKIELIGRKFEIIGTTPEGILSRDYLRKKILGLTTDEIKVIEEQLLEDKKFEIEMSNIEVLAGGEGEGGFPGIGGEGGGGGGGVLAGLGDLGGGEKENAAPGTGGLGGETGGAGEEAPEAGAEEEGEGNEEELFASDDHEDEEDSGKILLTSYDDDDELLVREKDRRPMKLSLKDDDAPIRALSQIQKVKYNQRRRKHGKGPLATNMPNFGKMLSPRNNSFTDPYNKPYMRGSAFKESNDLELLDSWHDSKIKEHQRMTLELSNMLKNLKSNITINKKKDPLLKEDRDSIEEDLMFIEEANTEDND